MDDGPFSGCLLSCRPHAHPLHHRLGGGALGEGAIMTYCSHDTVEPIIQVAKFKSHENFKRKYNGRRKHSGHEIKPQIVWHRVFHRIEYTNLTVIQY